MMRMHTSTREYTRVMDIAEERMTMMVKRGEKEA
jgi:hypothetical protein